MYATANKKMLNMLILEILKEYSDEEHRLTQQEIIRLLNSNYAMECDRRSVKNNILYLQELGYEISMDDGYYLISREFDDTELRMLIDSVLFSKSLTQKQAKSLVDKLRSLGNRYFSAKVSHIYNLPELHHADNKQMMYALDAINDAIAEKKKISFIYNEYSLDLKLHPKREAEYVVNPYQIVANNGFFYLIGNYDKYNNVSHYRIDKMTYVRILNEKVKLKNEIEDFKNGYSLPKHMAEHIYMFSGPSVRVKFLIPKQMINELVDWFGKDFVVQEDPNDMVKISVVCNESAIFFWSLQYGPFVEVVEPESLRERIKTAVDNMAKKYKGGIFIMEELIEKYKTEFEKMENELEWAVHKRFSQEKIVSCSVPFIGKEYFNQKKKVLIYASAEDLTDYYCGNERSDRVWLDYDAVAIDRHRWFFDNESYQKDSTETSGQRFFPDVHVQPMKDGALPTAVAFIFSELELSVDETPRTFYERIAFGNYGKFAIETDFQKKLRKTGIADKKLENKNIDYADNNEYLEYSHSFVTFDLEYLKPDIIIMPKTIYETDKKFIDSIKGNTKIVPIMQMNSGNINRIIKDKYEMIYPEGIDATVNKWYENLHENGIALKTKENYKYVFGYLRNVIKESGVLE